MVGRDDQIAGERQLETAAEGDAVDCGDERLVEVEALDEAGITILRVAAGDVLRLRGRFEIAARAERALAGTSHHAHSLPGVRRERIEGALQLRMHRLVQRVQHLRAVERDRQHLFVRLDLEKLIAHKRLLPTDSLARCSMPWTPSILAASALPRRILRRWSDMG